MEIRLDGERLELGFGDEKELAAFLERSASREGATSDRGEEEESLRRALVACDGDKRAAAARLGVSYRTVLRRVQRYDLEGFPKYRS